MLVSGVSNGSVQRRDGSAMSMVELAAATIAACIKVCMIARVSTSAALSGIGLRSVNSKKSLLVESNHETFIPRLSGGHPRTFKHGGVDESKH